MADKKDVRIDYITSRVRDFITLGESDAAADNFSLAMSNALKEGSESLRVLQSFLQGTGPNNFLALFQPEAEGGADVFSIVDPANKDLRTLIQKPCVWAARAAGKAINNKDVSFVMAEVTMGLLEPDVIGSFENMVSEVYRPLLTKQKKWGKNSQKERVQFMTTIESYTDHIRELGHIRSENIELVAADEQHLRGGATTGGKGARTADAAAVQALTSNVEQWISVVDRVVGAVPESGDAELEDESHGPLEELERWRSHLARLNLVEEQLKTVHSNKVINTLRDAKAGSIVTAWTNAESRLNEGLVETREIVKYLTSLKPFLDVLETGTPKTIIAMLPALMDNIKMMYTISRHYGTEKRMTLLFHKITNQMIISCKDTICPAEKKSAIWAQAADPESLTKLLEDLNWSTRLCEEYHAQFERVQSELKVSDAEARTGKLMDFPNLKIFGHFDLFVKRLEKLKQVFVTVRQFALLESYNIDQMDNLIDRFSKILKNLQQKTTDVLEIHDNNRFDPEFKQFDADVTELETSLQVTINSSFENITSTENALNLLKKFQTILQTETFRSDLDSKYLVIFHNYSLELENDHKLYEKQREDPPMVRNITPAAGAITWARQLLRHIKSPMDKFQQTDTVSKNPRDSRKIIKTYNRLSQALVDYETIWIDAYKRSIDAYKSGLNATLLYRNPADGRLYVNFDNELLELIKETRSLIRMGDIDVPASARIVLMQEAKLKTFYNELTYLVKEYDRVVGRTNNNKALSKIISMTRPLLKPNLDVLDAIIRPGETTLTWSSLNIDAYLASVRRGIAELDQLVAKVNDIVQNRIQENLRIVTSTLLVKLQDDHFPLDKFVAVQDKHIQQQSELMDIKNREVETAVDDVVATVLASQSDAHKEVSKTKITAFKEHFYKMMFQAILTTTTKSLNTIKRRVGTRNRVAFMVVEKPFFDVDVQLVGYDPYVILNPSLDEVQKAINTAATSVLSCSKHMYSWRGLPETQQSYFEQIAKEKEIVKVVLLLTGGIHGLRKQVTEYLNHFKKFEYLWKQDKEAEYQKFIDRNPTLDDFEVQLSRFVDLERELEEDQTYNIGSLSLNTEPLKQELRRKADDWRDMYAKNLHMQAQSSLDKIFHQFEEDERQLNQPIPEQLEELRVMMDTLRDVRQRESEIDFLFQPVQDKYALLRRFRVSISKEEEDRVADLHYKWRKLRSTAEKRTDEINQLQHSFKKGLTQEVQKFSTEVITFRNDYEANGPMVEGISPSEAMERLKRYQRTFEDKERKWNTHMAGEELFGLPLHKYPELVATKKELELLDKLYSLYMSVLSRVSGYNDILWVDLDFDKIAEEVGMFTAQCKKLPKQLKEWEAYMVLKKMLDDFADLAPLVKDLKTNPIEKRHWEQIMTVTGYKWRLEPDVFRLQNIVDANILAVREDVLDIAGSSLREADIERRYNQLKRDWKDTELTFAEFKNRGFIILKGDDTYTIKEALEEASLAVNSMLSSRFCDFKRDDVKALLNTLVNVSETLGLWVEVQATWMYLEAVFAGGDIMRQLPQEAKRFSLIDKAWTKIMNRANEVKNVLEFCDNNELLAQLPNLKDQLEECQRKLSAYLEQKRNLFPRFYFVSDTVLLEILSQASDPQSIQPHLCSIFDGIVSVKFERVKPRDASAQPYQQIVQLFSESDEQGEALKLVENVACQGAVEDWLNRLCSGMCASVREVVKQATAELPVVAGNHQAIKTCIDRYPAQVTLLILQMVWTLQVSECILSRGRTKADTSRKIDNVKTFLVKMTTSPELEAKPRRVRTNVETLITIQVHQEEVWTATLKSVQSITSFDWLRQARFTYKPERDLCIISIADSDTDYCNEYLGIKERLVITPLTDRCYITLSQALAMFMGGAPAGPAGTGKTETTKDLARTFGKFCVVFNCSDQLDRTAMGKIIRGLSQANAWGCFDEFNRIELPVLSVVAQQVSCVLQALKAHKSEFTFIDGQTTILKPGVGFFITMNPGYAGRQELPENLKILFRGVTMMVPDRQAIMKVKLASQGYQTNSELSKKFFTLYKLCEEQLSKQRHYDFGLRNILSVLRTAGAVLRKATEKDSEEFLFMRTLRDMNLSKLVFEDIDLFDALLADMFPNKTADKMKHEEIESDLDRVIAQKGLQRWDRWVGKVIQLYETKLVRHGIMVVGPALCGKSQCYDCMTDTLCKFVQHQQLRMNPKAITAPQMFGRMDAATGDWHDGIFASMWRRAVKASKTRNTWIVCDGPVDAIWIENLNTVLDDNKLLTLANGDRIFMTDQMKLCFEVENLANASPATVSRAGIVYISETILGWVPIIQSRLLAKDDGHGHIVPVDVLKACPPSCNEKLLNLFLPRGSEDDSPVTKVWNFYQKECEVVMRTSCAHLAINAFHLCVALADEASESAISDEVIKQIFWFSIAWAFGGMLEADSRKKMDGYIRTLYNKLPTGDDTTIFDYKLVVKQGEWVHWNSFVEKWKYPGDDRLDFANLFIPTLDSVRLHQLIEYNFKQRHSTLLMGVSGTAKTVTIEKFLSKASAIPKMEDLSYKKINFSSMTTPNQFYNALDDMVEKMGPNYGPKGGGQLALFIDDINMPEINEWGDQITNEIVRQVVEANEYCSLDKGAAGDKKRIRNLLYVAAMSHPSGGKNDVPNRLKRHFAVFNVPLPDTISIQQIFGTIFESRFGTQYSEALRSVARELTKMSIELWRSTAKKMLPTPAKFHYFFNLRDLSAIAQGLMNIGMFNDFDRPEKRSASTPWTFLSDPVMLVAAWRHECTRVFADKLNAVDDKKWFDIALHKQVEASLGAEMARNTETPLFFANFMQDPVIDETTGEQAEPAPKIYEPATLPAMQAKLDSYMAAHNETPTGRVRKLDLVLFDMAIKHVTRVSRCISMPRGNMLMVGVGGSGKQSLTRLATFVANYDYATIAISKNFSITMLFDAIRDQYIAAAMKRPVTFVFTDNEIKQEVFLEYINSFLSNGEIPGLFAADQKDGVTNEIRGVMKKDPMMKGVTDDRPDFLWKYFINRVRERLHFVLCFSPVGEKFRTRARKFPALISSCVINWLFPWPEDALKSVSERTLKKFTMETDDKTKESLILLMSAIHMMMLERSEEYLQRYRREVYSTPKSYLSFIQSYTEVYRAKHNEVNQSAEKINNGLTKLQRAADDVRVMKTQLQEKEVKLGQAKKETDALVKEIESRTAEAEAKRQVVEKVKNQLEADAAIVKAGQEEAERDLALAEPTLLRAIDALNSVTAADFAMLKQLKRPPDLIKRIFDGVAVLLHQPLAIPGAEIVKNKLWITDSWEVSGKGLAFDSKTLSVLQDFGEKKRDLINEETCELLLPYLWMEDFTREKAAVACGNVAGLCTWVRAMYDYINIAKVVAPKQERLRIAQNELRVAMKKKEAEEEVLNRVTREVEHYNNEFDAANKKKMALEEDANNTKKRADSATNLISALSGERERWTQQSNEFRDIIRRLVGDVALSCAFISYCGPFNAEFRHQLLNTYFFQKCKALKIPVTDNINIVKFLVDEMRVADWQMEGLPADSHSTQNAIMITTSNKWPLMIDPQGQALQWMRNRFKKDSKTSQLNDKRFLIYLQEQMGLGRPMIVENLPQDIDPMIDPILEKAVSKSGKNYSIKINETDMAYDEKFAFYMTTKLPNPSYAPEMFAKCLIIDFTVTLQGLEQQLLSRVISKEKSELNEESAKLTEEINGNLKRRKDLEDRLLATLANAKGALIDDVTLIQTLQETKDASAEIAEKLTVAVDTQKNIAKACEEYRGVARRGSILYFLIVEMSNVNPMYQTSLPQFLSIFDRAIDTAARPADPKMRIVAITDTLTYNTFTYFVRGLFSTHKLLFVLLMACKIKLADKEIDPSAFEAFLKGSAALFGEAKPRPSNLNWMKDPKTWPGVLVATEVAPKNFKQLPELISRNDAQWKAWYETEAAESLPIPDLNEKLENDPFDRMLLVRCMREDRTMLAASMYVAKTLGKAFAEPQQLDMEACYEETSGRTPIVFLLSQGSDPTTTIEAAARKLKKKVFSISMGQGQEPAAKAIVEHAWEHGEWALLQNCHLGLPFLAQLEEMLRAIAEQDLADEKEEKEDKKDGEGGGGGGKKADKKEHDKKKIILHEDARIWITSEPHPKFPIGLLQMSIKLTNEPPQGIRAGIIRSYSWLPSDILESFRRPEWKPLLFTQCFLHSVVQERRKFGPIGFCVPYEFNQGDWAASVQFLQNHLTLVGEDVKKGSVNYETIRYMVAEIQYGGRITDNKDRELFITIAKVLYKSDVCTPGYLFAGNGKDGSFKYGIPQGDELQKHREFVAETYPDVDPPEAFGMHGNADITYRSRQAQETLSTIMEIQPRGAHVGGGMSREDKVLQITDGYLNTLPKAWNPPKLPDKQPLTIFAGQEIDRLKLTIKVIRTTCSDLKLAVAGTIIMSPKLQDALDFIYDGRVPPAWVAVSWMAASVEAWFSEVMRRYEQLDSWARNGRPAVYWFPGFFNPQGFLTSVRQEITRSHAQAGGAAAWALDKVDTRTDVRSYDYKQGAPMPDDRDLPEAKAVLIYGLSLEGASWKARRLEDAIKGEIYRDLPVMCVYAGLQGDRPNDQAKGKGQGGRQAAPTQYYRCPVYKYPRRTDNFWIFDVDLPCAEPSDKAGNVVYNDTFFRLRGVCLVCSTE